MSEAVEILIEADDQASKKFKDVGDAAETQVKRIKDVGGKAKASTELVGTIANQLGGTQLGGFAGQLAQLTERISAFAEVSKSGGVGALAFKAGLVAAAGVVTYRVTEAIAGWWFEADRWRQAMEDGAKAAQKAEAAMDRVRAKKFADDRDEFSVIRDATEREAAINQRASQLEKQAQEMGSKIAEAKAVLAKETDDELRATTQSGIDSLEGFRDSLYEEAEALRDLTSERTKSIEARKAENAALDKQEGFIAGLREEVGLLAKKQALQAAENLGTPDGAAAVDRIKAEMRALEAKKNTVKNDPSAREEAERLLAERDAIIASIKAETEAEQAREVSRRKEQAAVERIADLQQKEMQNLEKQRIELTRGKEAAHAYALEMEGLDKATSQMIAAQQSALDLQKAQEVDKSQGSAAVVSRLLQFGRGGDPKIKIMEEIKAAVNKIVTNTTKSPGSLPLSSRTYETAVVP